MGTYSENYAAIDWSRDLSPRKRRRRTDGRQAGFYVQSDSMDPTQHMADGKMYDSKSAFRRATKAAGCIEVGNDPAILRPRKPIQLSRADRRDAIRRVMSELSSR